MIYIKKKNLVTVILVILITQTLSMGTYSYCKNTDKGSPVMSESIKKIQVVKDTLSNGLTILIKPVKTIPKVTVELWYKVGSKDEKLGEKGIAHLIEHMIFKGTKKLSESDINAIVYKLSGSCNAFTSYDYTGYIFNFPTQHYKTAFSLMADCMQNCAFDEQMLNSEMKAVIQELKMYKDNYTSDLAEKMIEVIFADHPYHYPVIGYKQDLWTVSANDLRSFYKKHYLPNNATLVVVGDVDPDEVIALANEYFGSIPADPTYKKDHFFFSHDIVAKSVKLYRDIQQPVFIYSFVTPGLKDKQDYPAHIAEWIFGKGRGSILYKKLVNELCYVTSLEIDSCDLFDHGLTFICCEPVEGVTQEQIKQVIVDELYRLLDEHISEQQITRAVNKVKSGFYSVLESTEDQADMIGKYFLATGDENYLFNSMNIDNKELSNQVYNFIKTYWRPSVMHEGAVLPLVEEEKPVWQHLQEISDNEDQQILAARVRTLPVQPAFFADKILAQDPIPFAYAKPETFAMKNGLQVIYSDTNVIPKISVVLSFKAQHFYDPDDKQGLYNFVSCMMTEGTKNYTADELADYIESKGMSLASYPGSLMITMLKEDFQEGLEIVKELLQNATFPKNEIEKVRMQLQNDLKSYWDEPRSFSNQLMKAIIYKNHPYAKNLLGTQDSINAIHKRDLVDFYKQYITPAGITMAIVGDIAGYNVPEICTSIFADWQGKEVENLVYPSIEMPTSKVENYYINRDQVVLLYARPSIARQNPDYDKLLIFDQIFGGGFLHSMNSRLFQLREETGLFYTINGTFLAGADEQPGMFQIKTIISLDRLVEAEKAITKVIVDAAKALTDQEFEEAKRAIVNAALDNFSSNTNIARTFLYLHKFLLPFTYFDNRLAALNAITKQDVIGAVKRVLGDNNYVLVRVGRVADQPNEKAE
ncbi:insulinase family protein [Candidatus Dependentiae bacterium]|nr:MAG: insulinase family protein [Candidatus Dependentiae bacterium]